MHARPAGRATEEEQANGDANQAAVAAADSQPASSSSQAGAVRPPVVSSTPAVSRHAPTDAVRPPVVSSMPAKKPVQAIKDAPRLLAIEDGKV